MIKRKFKPIKLVVYSFSIMCIISLEFLWAQELEFEKKISILDDNLLFQVWDAELQGENLLISDHLGFSLYRYNITNGKVIQTGRKGKGPGEFITGPGEIVLYKNNVITSDGSGVRYFHFFNPNLEFLNSKIIPGSFHSGTASKKLMAWCLTDDLSGLQKINLYDCNFKLLKVITPPQQNKKNLRANSFFLDSFDSKIIITYRYKNLIQIYDVDKNSFFSLKLKKLREETDYEYKKDVAKKIASKIPQHKLSYFTNWPKGTLIKKSKYWKNNLLFVQLGKFSENPYRDLLLIDIKGSVIRKFLLKKGEILLAVSKKYLITTVNERTEIIIYKIDTDRK